MGVEIERKFLVADRSIVANLTGIAIEAGLPVGRSGAHGARSGFRCARLRHDQGPSSRSGASRAEYEYEIPLPEAEELLDDLALAPLIEKTRYRVAAGRLVWEIDVFGGENDGLVVAEVELPSEATAVILPDWIGEEVTGDPRYYNANLVSHPYRDWHRTG